MKKIIDGILIVEGRNDQSYLSSFIECDFVVTNGLDVPFEEVLFLKKAATKKKVIALVDSDCAGEEIRRRINKEIPNLINVKVDPSKCNKNKKHGVAECERSEILNVLNEHFVERTNKSETINLNDLISIGIDDKEKREMVCAKLCLGKCNSRTVIKRINMLELTKDELKKAMD